MRDIAAGNPASPQRSRNRSPASAEVVVRRHAERQISELLGDRERALGECRSVRRPSGLAGVFAHVRRDPPQPTLIAEFGGQVFGIAEMPKAGVESS
jgi:hypothetical protein